MYDGNVKLGTRLLRDGVIGLSELEAGLRAQVLYGGRLGTNLVELGFLDVETLGRYLALSLGAPEATGERFESVSPDVIERFGADHARAFTAFPLGPEPDGTFAVAVLNPLDTISLLDLEKAIGEAIRPYTAAEMRIYYYLEKHYKIERTIRFVRTSSAPQMQGAVERRASAGSSATCSRRTAAHTQAGANSSSAAGYPASDKRRHCIGHRSRPNRRRHRSLR